MARSTTCRGREATLTWQKRAAVLQLRCSPKGCKADSSGPISYSGKSKDALAADVDGKVMLIRRVEAETPFSAVTRLIGESA